MQTVIGFATICVSIFGLICICISVGISYWFYLDNDTARVNSGLWRWCLEVKADSSQDRCQDVRDTDEQDAVRAMMFLGLIFVCGGISCIALKLFVLKAQKILLYAASGIYFFAGLFLITAFAVYDAEIFKPSEDALPGSELHAGFALCVIAWLVTWTAAGLSAAMSFIKEEGALKVGSV